MYRAVDAVLLRAGAVQVEQDWPDLAGGDSAQWAAWLQRVWSNEEFAQAVTVASPVVAARVMALATGQVLPTRQLRRLTVSVLRYLLRAQGRATPFGLFAGVAPARIGERLVLSFGSGHQAVARPDAVWLSAAVAVLEADPDLLDRLPVVANPLCFTQGDRLVVPWQANPTPGGDPREVAVRRTRPVEVVLAAAVLPVRVEVLARQLTADFPTTTTATVRGLLSSLVAQRVLLTALRPPMTATDPLAHVLAVLDQAQADAVPAVAPLLQLLRDTRQALHHHDTADAPAEPAAVRASLATAMAKALPGEKPLMVDLLLDAALTLPRQVAAEAEAAVSALTRLTPQPGGLPAWRDYRDRYLDRYGTGAVVPVLEITNPNSGLGFPARYREAVHEIPRPSLNGRDARLLGLAQAAAVEGRTETVLDDQAVTALARLTPGHHAQPHAELTVTLSAPTRAHLDNGDFTLTVTGTPRAAGTTTGRFLSLLDAGDRDRMAAAYAALPTLATEATPVQVSAPPLHIRVQNVGCSPAVLPHLLPLAEHPNPAADEVLDVRDLAVCGDHERMWLLSLSTGCPIEPRVMSAVEFRNNTQPLARFLCEITTAHTPTYTAFDWGAAGQLPFLPRIRYRRTVLAPARWRLAAADLPPASAPWPTWRQAAERWLTLYRVPGRVFLTQHDLRLRLDLDESTHLVLLRDHLADHPAAELTEAPAADAFGWIDGRPHEITMPMASTVAPVPAARRRVPVQPPAAGHLPGAAAYLSAKIYSHPHRHPEILTAHLPALLAAAFDTEPQWWYLHYKDPDPHLRLRLPLPDTAAYGPAALHLGTWAARLRDLGLITHLQLDTYQPEAGRYGHGRALAAAEAVFAADSRAAVAQLHLTAASGLDPLAVTGASMAALVTGFHGTAAGMRWLTSTPAPSAPTPVPREVYRQAVRLADPDHDRAALRATPAGAAVADAWEQRALALAAYRDQLTHTDPGDDQVLLSLLHLHHVRAIGIDRDQERLCHRLARAAALTYTAKAAR
ncbi:lantibiotic dehydratase [Kitasatospora sp. NPDC094011]|uniref:lantibiotic dehydratase n=1 Tax=Kitasatospora sp. NPDC094011 TaxID=3364090 RepID=UPI0038294104